MSERAVRVFVADDHPPYRDDISRAISERPGLELAGAADNGLMALDGIRRTRPEVAVLAVELAGLGGIDVTVQLVREEAPAAVLLLSASPEDVYEAVVAGAVGHLMRGARAERVCAAVEALARGERVLAPDAQDALLDRIRDRAGLVRAVLTEREHEVLRLTADGLSSPQIGAELHLSPTTVKSHLHRAYEKLGVSDRAAAVAVAMRSGLLE
jgi:two-component system nitrate/nitrite response regulator NarL